MRVEQQDEKRCLNYSCTDCGSHLERKVPAKRSRDFLCFDCRHLTDARNMKDDVQKQLRFAVHAIGRNIVSGHDPRLSIVFMCENLESWWGRQNVIAGPCHKDHIVPLSKLDLTDDRDLQLSFLGYNYQVVSREENLRKGTSLIPGILETYRHKATKSYIPHLLFRNEGYALAARSINHMPRPRNFEPHVKKIFQKIDDPRCVDFWVEMLKVQFRDDLFDLETAIQFIRIILESHFIQHKRTALLSLCE